MICGIIPVKKGLRRLRGRNNAGWIKRKLELTEESMELLDVVMRS